MICEPDRGSTSTRFNENVTDNLRFESTTSTGSALSGKAQTRLMSKSLTTTDWS